MCDPDDTVFDESTPDPIPPAEPSGRFRIIRQLAHGDLNEVWLVRDEEFNRIIVVKRPRNGRNDPETLARFQVEPEVISKLEHPGIVPIYSEGRDEAGPFYTMRYIRGETLREAVNRPDAQPESEGPRRVFRDLIGRLASACETIQYAHQHGVLHGRLGPSKILVTARGETFVIGWSSAQLFGYFPPEAFDGSREDARSREERLEETPRLLPLWASPDEPFPVPFGNPAYLSPELISGQRELLGPKTDVYGLGGILYYFLTGRPPGVGEGMSQLDRILRGEIHPPRVLCPKVPTELEAICLKALACKPADRYASARELADDLRRWLAGARISIPRKPIVGDTPRESIVGWFARRHVLIVSTLIALATAAVALGMTYLLNHR